MRTSRVIKSGFALAVCALFTVSFSSAVDFPPISSAEKTMTAVPGYPNAPAVTIFRNGEVWMMDERRGQPNTRTRVTARVKILTEAGKDDHSDIRIVHAGEDLRMTNFQARTVLSSGKVIPVGEDAIFKKQVSQSNEIFETVVAFPAVEVGAILDYSYDIRTDSMFKVEMWLFQSYLPTMHSEVLYHIPNRFAVEPWGRTTFGKQMRNESKRTPRGGDIRVWMDDLPPLPDEPYSWPSSDLSSVYMLIPTEYMSDDLFNSWKSTCRWFEEWYYRDARKKSKQAQAKVAQLTAGAATGLDRAQAIYRYVRDDVRTKRIGYAVGLLEDETVDSIIKEGEGSSGAKALALETMLDQAGLEADMVWVSDRDNGLIDLKFANPFWFDRTIVRVSVGGNWYYLDPGDEDLAFGVLLPGYDATPALVHDRKKPRTISLPAVTAEQNKKHAEIALELDDLGTLSGTGKITMTGHPAWRRVNWKGEQKETEKAWVQFLEDRFDGFEIEGLELAEDLDSGVLTAKWTMAQYEDEVDGESSSLGPTSPFGPIAQPFTVSVSRRVGPVMMPFAESEEVELTLTWPEGWETQQLPRPKQFENTTGGIVSSVEVDEDSRSLTYTRRFHVAKREVLPGAGYRDIKQLYDEAQKNDRQPVVLVAR